MERDTYTVTQFCDAHHIGRTHLYELLKQGRGPRIMKPGRRTLISREAAAEWRRAMEAASGFLEREAA
jgi:excisionase family DNA binding protein